MPVVEIYKFYDQNTFALWRPYGEKARVIAHAELEKVEALTVINEIDKELKLVAPHNTLGYSPIQTVR